MLAQHQMYTEAWPVYKDNAFTITRPCSVPPRSSSYHYASGAEISGDSQRRKTRVSKSSEVPRPRRKAFSPLHSFPSIRIAQPTSPGLEGVVPNAFPFPLQPELPKPLVSKKRNLVADAITPQKRRVSPANTYHTPPKTPDRYISTHGLDFPANSFRLSKSPELLSPSERLLRNNSQSVDPFSTRRTVSESPRTPGNLHSHMAGSSGYQRFGSGNIRLQNRQASAGSVWNVGGSQAFAVTGPIAGIPNGRGGILGSGTNAPMFTSRFFETETPDQSLERFEARLATALDIDQTQRVLSPPTPSRSQGVGKTGVTKSPSKIPTTTSWRDCRWVNDDNDIASKASSNASRAVPGTPFRVLDAPALRDDFYCSVLAYCRTSRVLAVGLQNRVYLWSELAGVQYPRPEENIRTVYVTSLSFSSTQGGHSILATGRSSGQVCLWSLFDTDDRFQCQQPAAVACLAFKPVTTQRFSEAANCNVSMEELLVGDETGIVYYYSIEWANESSAGSMNLMAKINIHSQQICGIAWALEGDCFATGGNDNVCCIFDVRDVLTPIPTPTPVIQGPLPVQLTGLVPEFIPNAAGHRTLGSTLTSSGQLGFLTVTRGRASNHRPVYVPGRAVLQITEGQQRHKWIHGAAVKAIAFCPWQRGLIATGGGSNDRAIHFYHARSGACLATINVQAQVTSLIWSKTRREIAATFGYAQPEHPYRIAVYSWPDCKQVVAIPWIGEIRALYAIAYPGGPNETTRQRGEGGRWWSRTAEEGCIVVASSDESVKFHEVWSEARKSTGGSAGMLGSDILQGLEGIEKDGAEVIR